jgi:hypothetical protein
MTRRALLLLFVGLGCSSPPAPNAPERVPLRHLAILYGKYRNAHRGAPPRDEADFKKFITGLDPAQLSAAGVSAAEVDTLFVSPRDGQPYEVRYNDPPQADRPAAVVAEKVGKGGKRMVAYSTGQVDEVDEAQYQTVRFTK